MRGLLSPAGGDVATLSLSDSLSVLRRRWPLLVMAIIAGAAAGFLSTRIGSPVFEAQVNLQIGTVSNRPLEHPRALARILESEAFSGSLAQQGEGLRGASI